MIKGTAGWFTENSFESLTFDDVQIVPSLSQSKTRADITTRTRLVSDIYIDHPVIPANMDTISDVEMVLDANKYGGVCFLHRFNNDIHDLIERVKLLLKSQVKVVGISLGCQDHDLWIAEQVVGVFESYGSNSRLVFLVDVAHGHHTMVGEFCGKLRQKFPIDYPIIAGNVATAEAAKYLWDHMVDGIKVGVGPGSLCSTRLETGCGVPQFTAIADVYNWAKGLPPLGPTERPTIIADGGIKYTGDILKAIGAGANSVMAGYLFAGTSRTPGEVIHKQGGIYKVYRGSASREAKLDRDEDKNIEGVAMEIPYRGETSSVFQSTMDGIRFGLSYAGMEKLEDAIGNVVFTRISPSSIYEATPHAVYRGSN